MMIRTFVLLFILLLSCDRGNTVKQVSTLNLYNKIDVPVYNEPREYVTSIDIEALIRALHNNAETVEYNHTLASPWGLHRKYKISSATNQEEIRDSITIGVFKDHRNAVRGAILQLTDIPPLFKLTDDGIHAAKRKLVIENRNVERTKKICCVYDNVMIFDRIDRVSFVVEAIERNAPFIHKGKKVSPAVIPANDLPVSVKIPTKWDEKKIPLAVQDSDHQTFFTFARNHYKNLNDDPESNVHYFNHFNVQWKNNMELLLAADTGSGYAKFDLIAVSEDCVVSEPRTVTLELSVWK